MAALPNSDLYPSNFELEAANSKVHPFTLSLEWSNCGV
jgi:hypothetical protein